MSFNRGNMHRDGGRRSMEYGGGIRRGGGGGGGGNYRSNYGNYNNSMNPWEGGMIPGRSGGAAGQGDLLSQLASPEAQLAIASNLINKLITQQQSGPSLLNLGSMGSGGGPMPYNDGFGNSRNFPDRRRGRMEHRRTEPYNKSAMNRRMGPDRRNLGNSRMASDRKTSFMKSPKFQKEDKDKKDKDADKANGDLKTDSTNDSKREDIIKKDGEENDEKEKTKDKPLPIPVPLLYCHVCCKNMWDELSFIKHMKGRPHQLMMDGINEKYKLKVDLLRHEMRLCEQQREMELERKHRQGMKMYHNPREYCAMCDLHFHGNLISHRKNVRHQKLKAFLHPKCSHCDKEFPTRLEWDDHRLTFDHLYKVADFRRATKPHIKDDEFDIDELVCPDSVNCGEMVAKEVPVLLRHNSEEDISVELKEERGKEKEVKKEPVDDEKEEKGEENKEEVKEPKAPQGIDVDPSKLPKHNPAVVIGSDLLKPVSGHVCQVCNRFLQGEEEAQVHCRTLSHHTNYCNLVRAKARITGRRKQTPTKLKDGKPSGENAMEEGKTDDQSEKVDNNGDDEGNWKRRKAATNEDEVEGKMEVDEIKTEDGDKDKIPDSEWEEVNKDINDACPDTKDDDVGDNNTEENTEEEQEELNTSGSKRPQRATRGRRGGKRGK